MRGAKRICSEKFLEDEVSFLVEMFVQNGHDKSVFSRVAETYLQTTRTPLDNESKPIIKLPWIPMVSPKLRKVMRKHGVKVVFTSGKNLSDILCKHKSPLPKNSNPGVYSVTCGCSGVYIGETKKKITSRIKEHKRDIFNGNYGRSGASEHAEKCDKEFDWESTVSLAREPDYFKRKIRESVEIRKAARSGLKVFNRDNGNLLKSDGWNILLGKLTSGNR